MPIRLTLFLLFLFAQICEVSYAQWMPVGTHISLGETSRFDFSIGKDDDLYISYMDKQNQSHITVMKFNGSSWDSLPSIQTSCWALSMAVDGNKIPYIAAETGANTEIWKYFNGQWNQVGTPLVAQGLSHASLVIGKNDTVYMAARDDSAPPYRRLSVWKFDGTAWQSVGSRGLSADVVDITSVSFTIDQSGIPYVAYRDQAANGRLTVKKFDGNSWVSVGSDGFSGAYLMRTSLVTDKVGVPYVAYNDGNNNFKATVKKFDGNAWVTVGTDGFSVSYADDFSLAMDKDDSLYIAYVSGLDDNAIVQKYDGVNWVNVGGLVSTGGTYLPILEINSKGVLYIAYDDHANNKRVIVKSYNKYAGITDNTFFKTLKIIPNPANEMISITGLPQNCRLQIHDVSGCIVYKHTIDKMENQLRIPVANFIPGVYFIEVHHSGGIATKTFVKH
jgi:hypothetical protein